MGINDATTPETVLFQDILHHKVVVVGIYPDIVAMFETPFEAGVSYSLLFAVGSHAVNDVIWFVVQRVAVIIAGLSGVLSGNKTECAYYFSVFIFANIVGSVGYFSQNQFNGRITVYPLVGVAMLFHELTGIVEYFYNCIQIFGQ